jgi:hypothetical protein
MLDLLVDSDNLRVPPSSGAPFDGSCAGGCALFVVDPWLTAGFGYRFTGVSLHTPTRKATVSKVVVPPHPPVKNIPQSRKQEQKDHLLPGSHCGLIVVVELSPGLFLTSL